MPMRTCLVMILAGVYVAYLGVSLCQNVINGAEGMQSWLYGCGRIFIVLGVAFVINGIHLRQHKKNSKIEKESDAEIERRLLRQKLQGQLNLKWRKYFIIESENVYCWPRSSSYWQFRG